MKRITFLGAAGTVTGSSYFLTDNSGKGILVDLGLFQGGDELERRNYETLPLHPSDIQAVFLTHAHLDHAGRLPLLRRFGYRGPIFMTAATKTIVELTLLDAAHIQKEFSTGARLYTEDDVYWVISQSQVVSYEQTVTIGSFSVCFRDAGHILGSAFLEVYCKNADDGVKKIVFSGDIGNYPEQLVKETEIVKDADVVLIESTYGDRLHADEDPANVLAEEIEAIEQSEGTLLIPAFSVERTQELLHTIDHLKKSNKVQEGTQVFLDSTLGTKVTHVYQQYRALYNNELTEHSYIDDPFSFPGLTMIEDARQSHKLASISGPKVIIAGSGMMNGGRIRRHARELLPIPSTRLLFVGFQGLGTLGRAILDGEREVIIDDVPVLIRASVRKSSGMSSHADQAKLLKWLSSIQGLQSICLVHGENVPRKLFAEKIKERDPNVPVYLPMHHTSREFGTNSHPYYSYGSSSRPK